MVTDEDIAVMMERVAVRIGPSLRDRLITQGALKKICVSFLLEFAEMGDSESESSDVVRALADRVQNAPRFKMEVRKEANSMS